MNKELTDREKEVLQWWTEQTEEKGHPPTCRECQIHFGFQSPAGVAYFLRVLTKKGVFRVERRGQRKRIYWPLVGQPEIQLDVTTQKVFLRIPGKLKHEISQNDLKRLIADSFVIRKILKEVPLGQEWADLHQLEDHPEIKNLLFQYNQIQ